MTAKQALKTYFGYSEFRSGQEEIINHILSKKNVLAVLPTGAGKSLCYQIPALISDNYSIVISPLIALMKDQVDLLNKENHLASFINSSLDFRETQKVLSDIRNNNIKLLYVSPERLSNISFADEINESPPDFIFIDEAHCISEWGHNFRPSYRKISEFINHLNIKNLSAFTATATPEVRKDILEQLSIPDAEVVVRGFERDNLSLEVLGTRQKKEKTYAYIKKYRTPAIIYASTRKQAEEADEYLRSKGVKSAFYHAGLASGVRTIIQDDFINDRINVITATNAFGMGIDKKDVRLIVHYSIPSSLENYYQEIGRAGRDGNDSKIVLFYESRDKELQDFLINMSYPTINTLRLVYNSIYDYARIAVGSKKEDPVELEDDFYLLLKKNNITEALFKSSLRTLENTGYLETLSDFDRSHLFRFLLDAQKLQAYVKQIANSSLRDTIVALLKMYGSSPFAQRVKIDFNKFKELVNRSRNDIQDDLLSLSSIGIIEYDMPGSNMKLLLKERRISAKNILFDDQSELLRKNALDKLDRMIEYINSGDCRFKIILEYFGEEAPDYKCGKCDNCVGINLPERETFEYLEEIIINSIHESGNKISERDLINILIGHSPSGRLSGFSNFGTCTHFKKDELKNAIHSLINKNLLIQFDRHLSLSESAINFFSESKESQIEEEQLTTEKNYSLELFHQLKRLRNDIAKKFSQPPEIICNDVMLREISEKKPETESQLLNLDGMNNRVFHKIGEDILFTIKEFLKSHANNAENKEEVKGNLATIKKLVNNGYSLEEISGLLKISDHLISLQIESLLTYDTATDISKLIQKKEVDLISSKIDEGITELKELKQELPGITYAKLRIVMAKKKFS